MAIRGIPQADTSFIVATDQLRSVQTPLDPAHDGRRGMADPAAGSSGHLPQVHPALVAPTCQKLSIRTPRYAIEKGVDVVTVPQELYTGARARIPHPDSTRN